MRLNGDYWNNDSSSSDEEKGNERVPMSPSLSPLPQQKLVVGYALTSKKVKSFLQPKLEGFARKKGILFVEIDQHHPLSEQGPFDIVLHKLTGKEWRQILEFAEALPHSILTSACENLYHSVPEIYPNLTASVRNAFVLDLYHSMAYTLEPDLQRLLAGRKGASQSDYREKHPEVTVLDPPDAIQHLLNRQSMLQDVADLNLSDSYGKVCVPKQLVISKDPSSIPDAVTKAELALPLVVKPLVVDGSAKSHELSLAYDPFSLSKLEPPLVLQEFVNHGGVLFKVYIVGETIRVVRRFSLPDVDEHELLNNTGVFRFPRVSCAAASAEDADLDPGVAELPPGPLLEKLARELRCRLGLRLFNIDIIREHGTRDRFYVIDINYFPGYGKMPGYEQIFTDFLLGLVKSKYKRRVSNS